MPIGILTAQINVYLLTQSALVIVLGVAFILVSLLALFVSYRQFFLGKDAAKANISVKTTTKMIETMVTWGSATKKIVGIVAATPRTERLLERPDGLRRNTF